MHDGPRDGEALGEIIEDETHLFRDGVMTVKLPEGTWTLRPTANRNDFYIHRPGHELHGRIITLEGMPQPHGATLQLPANIDLDTPSKENRMQEHHNEKITDLTPDPMPPSVPHNNHAAPFFGCIDKTIERPDTPRDDGQALADVADTLPHLYRVPCDTQRLRNAATGGGEVIMLGHAWQALALGTFALGTFAFILWPRRVQS